MSRVPCHRRNDTVQVNAFRRLISAQMRQELDDLPANMRVLEAISDIAERIMLGNREVSAGQMAERLGFRAVYLSGGALSAASGVPDVGLLTLPEFVEQFVETNDGLLLAAVARPLSGPTERFERRAKSLRPVTR